jgi:hypothetical protein
MQSAPQRPASVCDRQRAMALLSAAALLVFPAAGQEPLELVPAEALLTWHGQPFPDTRPVSEEPTPLGALIDVGTRIAGRPLDQRGQLTVRLLEALSLMVRYPHALALIDAEARPLESDGRSRKVDKLKIVMIVRTGESSGPFRRVVQKVINEQTGPAFATLALREAGRWKYQELHDSRLPEWCAIAWGEIGEYFVLTLGRELWPAVAAVAEGRAPSMARDDWVRTVRGKRGPALIEIVVSARAIRERLDPFVQGRASDFFEAWNALDLERAHWALGFEGRAMYCLAHFLSDGTTRARLYADPQRRDPDLLAAVPEGARYALYRVPLEKIIPQFFSSLYVTRGREYRARATEVWEKLQTEQGFDAGRDLLALLGENVVMHNAPPHPLHLPLMFTMLLEIREEPRQVRDTLEKIGQAWQATLQQAAERSGQPGLLSVLQDPDGIWYVQFGPIATIAWTVTDRYVITSWSPHALREYLQLVGPAAGSR